MDLQLNGMTRSWRDVATSEDGFSLIEALVSMMILTTGLVSLAGVLALGLQRASTSAPALIAREKAREAVESVHTARDTGALSWNMIQNDTATGGVFRPGFHPLRLTGEDGLINTADDPVGSVEEIRTPGDNRVLGDGDDEITPLHNFQRRIEITPLMRDDSNVINPFLRQLVVTVQFTVNGRMQEYVLRTYISNFS